MSDISGRTCTIKHNLSVKICECFVEFLIPDPVLEIHSFSPYLIMNAFGQRDVQTDHEKNF